MAMKGSRYERGDLFVTGAEAPFKGYRPRLISTATPVLEYRVKEGDRLDLLALYFYKNDRKWWRILDANPSIVFGADLSLDSSIGEIILIPGVTEPGGLR